MKKNIHPKLNKVKIQMTDGSVFETMTTMGKDGDTIKLDIDPKSHPAWTGENQKVADKGRVSKFNKRFGNLKNN
jgi:large subunit ribosomal protein L31